MCSICTSARRRTAFTRAEFFATTSILAFTALVVIPAVLSQDMPGPNSTSSLPTVCLSNLRVQAQAMHMYALDNEDIIPSGLMFEGEPPDICVFGTPHWAFLPYVGYNNEFGSLRRLWPYCSNGRVSRLESAFAATAVYQCPEHPDPTSPLDYVTNAMDIPYTGDDNLVGLRNASDLAAIIDPARYVYMTESHASLYSSYGPGAYRVHQFFLPLHLPLAGMPRIANDRRHRRGVNVMFFDGHAAPIALETLDPGFPAPLCERLTWFSPCSP